MHKNYTLKQAVKTVFALMAMSAHTNVFALGLGNLEVDSYLGQPLHARIQVQGTGDIKSTDCFHVVNDNRAENQLYDANFKLSKSINDVGILTVTTNQVLNEPIMNLSIAAECGASLRRDYVLLLDPPLTTEVDNHIESSSINQAIKASEKPNAGKTPATRTPQTAKANKKPTSVAKETVAKKEIILTAGYHDVKPAENSHAEPKEAVAKEYKPRLSISGGAMSAMTSYHPQLRMDTQLHFTAVDAPVPLQNALVSDIEMHDEVTMLNNRMAHLQQQISHLTQTNQILKTENQTQQQQLEATHSAKNNLDWLGYILGGALLLSSTSIAGKWRMRRQDRLFAEAQFAQETGHLSTGLNSSVSFFDLDKAPTLNDALEEEADSLFASADTSTQFSVEEFNDEHNILDHADVFLSHGRTSLAIQLLQNHLIEHPKNSVAEWLFLLDLLAKENMQAVYEQTALECKEHFNIRVADFTNDEGSAKRCLEDYPRLIAGLEDVWGTPAAQVYLDDLIYNSRLEARVGFEKTVLEELLLLKNLAHETGMSAQVIQLDDKKLVLKAQKEAKLAADKEERLRKVNALIEQKTAESRALAEKQNQEATFEFTLAEYN